MFSFLIVYIVIMDSFIYIYIYFKEKLCNYASRLQIIFNKLLLLICGALKKGRGGERPILISLETTKLNLLIPFA